MIPQSPTPKETGAQPTPNINASWEFSAWRQRKPTHRCRSHSLVSITPNLLGYSTHTHCADVRRKPAGNAVSLLGYNPLNPNEDQNLTAVLSLSLDDGPVIEQAIPAQQLARHEFYSATNLGRRPDGIPHTLNMTLKSLATNDDQRFQISGYMYSPTFASLGEADGLYAQWIASGNRTQSADEPKNLVAPVAGGVVGGFVMLLCLVALILLHRRKIKRLRESQEQTPSEVDKTAGNWCIPKCITLIEIFTNYV